MKIYSVKPSSSKEESFYLIIVVMSILLMAIFLLNLRVKPIYSQKISDTEISAYQKLNSIELGIYSEILNSLIEINMLIEDNKYPSIEKLKAENIPPFFNDKELSKDKNLSWILVFHDGEPLYVGSSKNTKNVGSFLIEINKDDINKSYIYYLKEYIDSYQIEKDYDSIKNKLKKIVPYTGNDERKKFKED